MEPNSNLFENRIDLNEIKSTIQQIREEARKILVGQEQMLDLLITAILSDGHVLIEGVPGVAKTLTAKILSRIIAADFSRIQFTPDLMPSDILGTNVYNLQTSEFNFKQGPVFSNIVLIDEINRAPAKTQSALFEVMEEKQATIDGKRYEMGFPFLVVATQNPIEQEGTYRLPEAQLDRFLFKIEVNYPTMEEEVNILEGFHKQKSSLKLEEIRAILSPEQIQRFRELVNNVEVDQQILRYIAQIIERTRNSGSLYLGASPRASLAILSSSKAYAAIQGRDFVTPDDIKQVAYPVLRHRIILTPEKEMEGAGTDKIIEEIINEVEVPR
ncbi:MoxR family ATPase [Rapidithrix thailandica]|uniref:MoxR family ATPase n=1 Tax=Rapidithrix thailandica TaxID=413964 RepID=A0AAW9S9L3_9BACT